MTRWQSGIFECLAYVRYQLPLGENVYLTTEIRAVFAARTLGHSAMCIFQLFLTVSVTPSVRRCELHLRQHRTANLSSNLSWSSCSIPYTWDMYSVSEGLLHWLSVSAWTSFLPVRVLAVWGISCCDHEILLISRWGHITAVWLRSTCSVGQEPDMYLEQCLGRTEALVRSAMGDNTRPTLWVWDIPCSWKTDIHPEGKHLSSLPSLWHWRNVHCSVPLGLKCDPYWVWPVAHRVDAEALLFISSGSLSPDSHWLQP